ncbi:hypothetical protein H312_00797 [Anncaliia algerae PRA339]|uniref:ISXO2-like transposase domain-containing protein n=1 Tax=Anncaliia algerae PRA339 TaxID=1288291 RepID=A0A059F3S5_9MICR|nr:hypothetical protein H312_00797 [Anncaliia algerae PRA339]
MCELGYEHYTVNHSRNFVDPHTRATTNHVESMWQKVKTDNKKRYGTHRTTLDSHLGEFMWKQRFGNSLVTFFDHIKEQFELN